MQWTLSTAVTSWLQETAWETRLEIRLDGGACLLFRRPTLRKAWIELHLLDGEVDPKSKALRGLGFRRRRHHDGARAYGLELQADQQAVAVLAQLDRVFSVLELSGVQAAALSVACQRSEPPSNPRLLEAIRAASTRQDDDTRKRLYAALVNSTLLVPLDPTSVGLPEAEQMPLKGEGGSWVAFSDWDAIRQWRPAGHAFGLVHGVDFFVHASRDSGATVRINPQGVVGGELYASEVAMMASAAQRYLASRQD